MPISLILEKNLCCPVVICDQCGMEIKGSGNVYYDGEALWMRGEKQSPVFLHKNCTSTFEAANGGRLRWFWQELHHFLTQLCDNEGLTPKKMQDAREFNQLLF